MARNGITDGWHRTRTDAPASVELATGEVVVYCQENPDAWIKSDTTADPREVQ